MTPVRGYCPSYGSKYPSSRVHEPSSVPGMSSPHDTPLARELRDDALERFVRYARIDTQSDRHSTSYPSTMKQLDLSRLLVEELHALALTTPTLTEHGYVFATLPGTAGPPSACALTST